MRRHSIIELFIFILLFSLLNSNNALAAKKPADDITRVVIHVTNNSKRVYQAALNYSYSLTSHYGDKAKIEIVANGPGIGLLNKNNNYTNEIKELLDSGVKISACNTTVRIMRKFKELPIIEGVTFTPTGVVRVIELQKQGYLYLHP